MCFVLFGYCGCSHSAPMLDRKEQQTSCITLPALTGNIEQIVEVIARAITFFGCV